MRRPAHNGAVIRDRVISHVRVMAQEEAPGRAKQARIEAYDAAYQADVGFESVMVWARQRTAVDFLSARRPAVVIEVGGGPELLVDVVARDAPSVLEAVSRWVIVEPNPAWAQAARAQVARARRSGTVAVVEGFVEDCVDEVLEACPRPPDAVLCASVLHEVPDPVAVVEAMRSLLRGGGTAHVNVPNAASLHRRLALSMGLVDGCSQLGRRNRDLEQFRVFDAHMLRTVLEAGGFDVIETGGAFLKPFTHDQMASLPFLSPAMLDGLYALGAAMPELAAQIHANAEPRLGRRP